MRVRLEHESPAPEAGREARGVQAHPGEEPPALPQLAVRRDGLHGSELLSSAMVVRGEISRLRRLQRLREDDGRPRRVGEEDESERPLLLASKDGLVNVNINPTINIITKYEMVTANPLLKPLLTSFLVIGFNNHAINQPINNGEITEKIFPTNDNIFHSPNIRVTTYTSKIINKIYNILPILFPQLTSWFNLFVFNLLLFSSFISYSPILIITYFF